MNLNSTKECAAKPATTSFEGASRVNLSALLELTKPRLSILSVFTASLGYLAYSPLKNDPSIFLSMMLGTVLAAAGSASLNQWIERREDARMSRTSGRPLPSSSVEPETALWFGLATSGVGLVVLWFGTNPWATSLTLATLVIYLLFYTPMKKWTTYATEVGAVAGALPPLIGWVAAAGAPSAFGWVLFGILFAWQMPHFMAISWTYREDYRKAGFKMLAHEEGGASKVARKSMLYAILLGALAISPVYHDSGTPFLCVAAILSLGLLFYAFRFVQAEDKTESARTLFFVTIIHLPLLLTALVIDRFF